MPAERTTTAVPAARRSAFPQLAGVSPGFAVLIAITATLAGFALEVGAGHAELGSMFAGCYALGCIAAVLLVRQSGVFTAVIQPPLLLFVAVPLSYFLLHGSEFSGLKGFLITCGYPLIERFPLMFFTTVAVLLIGMARWYAASAAPREVAAPPPDRRPSAGLIRSLLSRLTPERDPRHGIDRSASTPRPARAPRDSTRQPQRRREEGAGRRREPSRRPARDQVPPDSRRQRNPLDPRVARASEQRVPRGAEPPRRVPRERREPYPPRQRYGGDYPSYGARDQRYAPREAYPADPRAQRSRPQPPPGPRPVRDSTHHPVSRVRYRGGDPDYPDHPPRR